MAATKTLAATVRSASGKGAARSVRREGRVPGVIYGGGEPPKSIALGFKELNQLIYAGHFLTTIFEIDIEGDKERVIPRDYQLDVVKDTPLHVDFLRLKRGSRLRLQVPVHFVNQETSPGIKLGGSLNIVRHGIEMWVPGDAIPEAVTIDVGALQMNESVHASAVALPTGCKPVDASDFTIASIAPPTVLTEEEEAPAATEEGAAKPATAEAPAPAKK